MKHLMHHLEKRKMTQLKRLPFLPICLIALCLVCAAASVRAEDNADWLKKETERLIEGCKIESDSGVLLHTPDGLGYYKEKKGHQRNSFLYNCLRLLRMSLACCQPSNCTPRGIRTPMFITHEGEIESQRDTETLASNIDIAPTILRACGIEPPKTMSGLDLRDPAALEKRNRVFVDVYEHNGDLDRRDDLDDGLMARVVVTGWNKLIDQKGSQRYNMPPGKQLYDLKNDPD